MKTRSNTTRLIDRLKRFYSFGGLIAGMTLAASAERVGAGDGRTAALAVTRF
jgi:hypothetical protein